MKLLSLKELKSFDYVKTKEKVLAYLEDIVYKNSNKIEYIPREAKEFYENMELVDKENLRPLEMVISKIFKNNYEIKYKTTPNHRAYLNVTLNRKITSTEKGLLIIKISKNKYHSIIEEKEDKIILEIHNKQNLNYLI